MPYPDVNPQAGSSHRSLLGYIVNMLVTDGLKATLSLSECPKKRGSGGRSVEDLMMLIQTENDGRERLSGITLYP